TLCPILPIATPLGAHSGHRICLTGTCLHRDSTVIVSLPSRAMSPHSPAAPAASSSTSPAAPPRLGFRPDVQGLRGIAVMLVVLYHAGLPGLSGGFVGVDAFFVLSGFLITTHLLESLAATGRIRLGQFYARRARRLLPAALTVAALTLLASWALLSPLLVDEV